MIKVILLLLFFRVDNDTTIVDTFDRIEVNHYHNEYGAEKWTQLICWDWNGRKSVFHVQHWIMMKDAYKKTEQGEKKWNKTVRDYADKIRNWEERRDFLNGTKYIGDFTGGKYYPFKNFKTRYWEVKFFDKGHRRIIKSKIFTETHSQYDPEVADREFFRVEARRGLIEIKTNKRVGSKEWQAFVDRLTPFLNR